MSFQPLDKSTTGKPAASDEASASSPSAATLAKKLAGAVGVDPKDLAAANLALDTVSALHAGEGVGALVQVAVGAALLNNPAAAKALHGLDQAKSLLEQAS
ncbi:hypothetical protein LE190_16695 [Massilia oculi]|uniref:Uncharacterized protein n=1 Tax=Massilia hydrophila TaxID=3044279 RepID=A0ABS7YCY2_9BURK|nr:hypothetical protein [Massilia oculi]MCA1857553.1 hypothetical protein [Massilia oculi]